jgi:hypothetical protein
VKHNSSCYNFKYETIINRVTLNCVHFLYWSILRVQSIDRSSIYLCSWFSLVNENTMNIFDIFYWKFDHANDSSRILSNVNHVRLNRPTNYRYWRTRRNTHWHICLMNVHIYGIWPSSVLWNTSIQNEYANECQRIVTDWILVNGEVNTIYSRSNDNDWTITHLLIMRWQTK